MCIRDSNTTVLRARTFAWSIILSLIFPYIIKKWWFSTISCSLMTIGPVNAKTWVSVKNKCKGAKSSLQTEETRASLRRTKSRLPRLKNLDKKIPHPPGCNLIQQGSNLHKSNVYILVELM